MVTGKCHPPRNNLPETTTDEYVSSVDTGRGHVNDAERRRQDGTVFFPINVVCCCQLTPCQVAGEFLAQYFEIWP